MCIPPPTHRKLKLYRKDTQCIVTGYRDTRRLRDGLLTGILDLADGYIQIRLHPGGSKLPLCQLPETQRRGGLGKISPDVIGVGYQLLGIAGRRKIVQL